jgi:diaminopimelate epimerase
MVKISFWKTHGLGNDYIVIDNRNGIIKENEISELAKKICRRRFSIGADGLLLLYNSNIADIKMRIFNLDGSEAEMCGNGIRCVAKYCYEKKIINKKEINIETLSGIKKTWLLIENGKVTKVKVDMGKPIFEKFKIPMIGEGVCINEELKIDGEKFEITCLSIGNPHCVIFIDNVKDFPIEKIGPKIENHEIFPNRINVEFVQVLNKNELIVRVWERGCGETFACGTGACASVIAGKILGKVNSKAIVHLIGGDLEIEYNEKVLMTGPVEKSFEGFFDW